jgi:hypothetical protein
MVKLAISTTWTACSILVMIHLKLKWAVLTISHIVYIDCFYPMCDYLVKVEVGHVNNIIAFSPSVIIYFNLKWAVLTVSYIVHMISSRPICDYLFKVEVGHIINSHLQIAFSLSVIS